MKFVNLKVAFKCKGINYLLLIFHPFFLNQCLGTLVKVIKDMSIFQFSINRAEMLNYLTMYNKKSYGLLSPYTEKVI